MGRVAGHRSLLDPQRFIRGRSEESRYTRCMSPSEGHSPEILPHDTSTSVGKMRGHTNGANGARVPRDTPEGNPMGERPTANGAPHPDARAYAKKFSGIYAHRVLTGGIGHNLPQAAPQAFAEAVLDVDGY
jgi:hypothetical protein